MSPKEDMCLKSGEVLISRKPHLIATVLGSCVAVTLFNSGRPMAAICHAMLPKPSQRHVAENEKFKYVCFAIPKMLSEFHKAGVRSEEIEVKMFGGANVIGLGGEENSELGIGDANIQMACLILREHRLRLKASDAGGYRGRKIFFDTATGEVFHKYLAKTLSPSQIK